MKQFVVWAIFSAALLLLLEAIKRASPLLQYFLVILGAFVLAVTVITWAVGRVKDPPDFWRQ